MGTLHQHTPSERSGGAGRGGEEPYIFISTSVPLLDLQGLSVTLWGGHLVSWLNDTPQQGPPQDLSLTLLKSIA